MRRQPTGQAQSALADNVIPTVDKRVAKSLSKRFLDLVPRFDPDAVVLHRADGGFNCVVELAATYCLRHVANQLDWPEVLVWVTPAELATFLQGQATPFSTGALNSMSVDNDPSLRYAVRLVLKPLSLRFEAPRKVCITFDGYITLLHERRRTDPVIPQGLLERLIDVGPGEPPGPPPSANPFKGDQPRRSGWSEYGISNVSESALLGARLASANTYIIDSAAARLIDTVHVIQADANKILQETATVGSASLTTCCDYFHELDSDLARVDVYAYMKTARSTVVVPHGDSQRFYDRFLASRERDLLAQMTQTSKIALTRTIALTGENPSQITVSELADIDASAFHVDLAPLQALVVAFDLQPGCQGTIEDVQHFIGDQDYGVISDEYMVERVCKHKWRLGGFDRAFRIASTIKIKRSGNVEDAQLRGSLELDTLDFVAIDTAADARTDHIRLGGWARAVPRDILLNDGNVVSPDKIDLGPPKPTPWTIFTTLSIDPEWSPDLEIREFQSRAHSDAFRHLARPFARSVVTATPEYSRLEGVTKQLFVLGSLRN